MEWAPHDEWADKFGIPKEVSREINIIVDSVKQGSKIPDDYTRLLEQCASEEITDRPRTTRNSALDLVAADYAKRRHDVSMGSKTGDRLASRLHKCALKKKGPEYVAAWYLHHHLDYLSKNKDSGKEFEQLVETYRENHPNTHSEKVEEFLLSHKQELVRELGL